MNVTLDTRDVARAAFKLYWEALRARRNVAFPSLAHEYAERAIPLLRALLDSVNPPRDEQERDERTIYIEALAELSFAMPSEEDEDDIEDEDDEDDDDIDDEDEDDDIDDEDEDEA